MSGDNMSLKFGDEKSKKKSIEIKHGAENIVPERSEKSSSVLRRALGRN